VILYVQNLVSVGPLVLLKLDNDLKVHRNHLVILYLELFFLISLPLVLILDSQIKQFNLNYICINIYCVNEV